MQGRDIGKIRKKMLKAIEEGRYNRDGNEVKLKGGCRAIIRNNKLVTIKPKLRIMKKGK